MRKVIGFLFFILIIDNVCAYCEEGQIDVNSASLEKLDEIYGIGPAKAQAIIDARPYENLDDLVNAYGIGEATLDRIKSQGIACVSGDDYEEKDEEKIEKSDEKDDKVGKEIKESPPEEQEIETHEKIVEIKTGQVISLVPQNIKGVDNLKKLDKGDYAVYGFVIFSILLCLLFILKWRKGKDEIE